MRKNTVRLSFSIIFGLLLISAKSGKVDLKYNLSIGAIYKISTVTEQALDLTLMGQQQNVKNRMESVTAFKVQEIEKNTIKLDTWFEQLKISIETPMGALIMDSDTTKDITAGSMIFSKIINKHFTVKMASNGEVLEVNGIDKIMDGALNNTSDINAVQLPMIKENLRQMVSNDAFKGNIEMSTYCLPGKPVSIGDQWTSKFNLASAMNSKVDSNWQLTDSKDGISSLSGTGKLQSKNDGATQNMNGIPIKYDITGEQKTVSKIDEKTGWIIESTVDQEITGEMVMDLTQQGGGVQKVPLKIMGKSISKGIK